MITPLLSRMKREPRSNLNDKAAVDLLTSGRLQQRDIKILNFVWQTGLASTQHITRAFFYTVKNPIHARNATNRRLSWMYREYCLKRFTPHYRSEAVYFLDIQGARLIRMEHNKSSFRDIHWSARKTGQKVFQLKHTLGITESVVRFMEAGRKNGFSLLWRGETHLQLTTAGGYQFTPDGFGLLSHPGKWRLPFYFEWDEATESISQIAKKLRRYHHYARHENEWRTDIAKLVFPSRPFNRFPLLIFITTGGRDRLKNMLSAANSVSGNTFDKHLPFPVLMSNQTLINEQGIWGKAFFTPDAAINGYFEWQHARTITSILTSGKGD